jgi:signal transduction histidine kinase
MMAPLRPSVLIVQDSLELRFSVREIVSSAYRVYTASNGEEALAVLRAHEIDAVMSEVRMPVMDGLELLRRLKGHASWKFIPFILLSARIVREERLQGLDDGADDYLATPFDAAEILTRLRMAMRTRAMYRELDANRAKDQFLANMSHEMRTPLTAIIGFSDLIATGVSERESREFQETIRRNADHLLSLIDEILDFSKIESGVVTGERSPIALEAFFNAIESSFKAAFEEKGLDFELCIDARVASALVTDARRLRQMTAHLIGNAVKFTERGSVRVEVQTIDDRGSLQLKLRVIDTGIGIARRMQSKVFSPFSQVDMSLSRKFGGTGLGLALSRKIARSLGGDLRLETSRLGVGSTFALWIPVERVVSQPVQPTQSAQQSDSRATRLTGSL